MSTTAVRRLKERGGAGGKITASIPTTKSLTPISQKPSISTTTRKSVGKENPNPRSISKVAGPAEKPTIRPMPRMSSGDGEARPKSRPRGRSPSPSDFSKILSDIRKTRVSSVVDNGVLGKGLRGLSNRVGEKEVNGSRASVDGRENGNVGGKFRDFCEKGKIGDRRVSGLSRKESNLSSISVKSNVNDGNCALGGNVDHCVKDGSFSVAINDVENQGEYGNKNSVLKVDHSEKSGAELSNKEVDVKSAGNSKGSDGRVGNKYASRLHEKLAYLEGKVKRIASDIKKTKEMLDSNKTDESKMILSDIQEKISGIEKAMGSVIADSGTSLTSDCSSDLVDVKCSDADIVEGLMHDSNQNKQEDSVKVPVKGLSSEELEARLFPHHKLLRDRTSLNVSGSDSQTDQTHVSGSKSVLNLEKTLKSLADEDPIALEFLASLNVDHSEVIATEKEIAMSANEVQETEDTETSTVRENSGVVAGSQSSELDLEANERLDEFDEQENKPAMKVEEEMEENAISQLVEVGRKTSTGGWFVSEGESVLLAHDDGSCSFYDIVNHEEKAEYSPPAGMSRNVWTDCWIIRAPGADGCSGKYVVAASAGNTMDSGFCTWDFYSKNVQAFHIEDNKTTPRVALGRLPDNIMHRRNTLGGIMSSENQQWWFRPCGPLIISTATSQRGVKVFDIRDGEQIMKWDVQRPVWAMDHCSPVQWRNRGKVVIAENEAISLWDVSSLNSQVLSSVSTSGRTISALHVNNTDAELGGGVRQRVSSSEAEGNDGVFCTADSINILDFRHPSGIGLKIPKIGVNVQSVSSKGDSVFLGCSSVSSLVKKQVSSQVLQFSVRKQRIVNTYMLPESNAHPHHKALTQVWGNSNLVMATCGLGLFVFDTLRDDVLPAFAIEYSSPQKVREVIGPDDLYSPSFDYTSSQILLISRDRPAMWRHLL